MLKLCQLMMAPGVLVTVSRLPCACTAAWPLATWAPVGLASTSCGPTPYAVAKATANARRLNPGLIIEILLTSERVFVLLPTRGTQQPSPTTIVQPLTRDEDLPCGVHHCKRTRTTSHTSRDIWSYFATFVYPAFG